MSQSYAVGMDLGTCRSAVGVFLHQQVEIIPFENGERTMPSQVAFTSEERLVGDAAVHRSTTHPQQTIFDVKRLMGRRMDDPSLAPLIANWPFTVASDADHRPQIVVEYKGEKRHYSPV